VTDLSVINVPAVAGVLGHNPNLRRELVEDG
jgi:hypothetical protein